MRRPNLRKIVIAESEESQFKGPENIFKQIIEEISPSIKK